MILIKKKEFLQKYISNQKENLQKVGFVPTMGALHDGHISLILKSLADNDLTVCSIFVNPTQFNNIADLEKYPNTIEADINLLEKAGCDVLFYPDVVEMYPEGENAKHYELGFLEEILEGKYRPGHFQGVCRIVDKLLNIVDPSIMYLGSKDYQQCKVICKMMHDFYPSINLEICETIRETDGLAMSSRNKRLNAKERAQATHIINALINVKKEISNVGVTTSIKHGKDFLEENAFKVDYLELADAGTLQPATSLNDDTVLLVAAYLNDVRLIDNILLKIETHV